MDIATVILSFCGFIGGSGLIGSLILRRIDRLERMLDRRESDRVEENIVRGEVIHTSARLCAANTVALRAVTSDEVCSPEFSAHAIAMDRLEHFLREKSAEYLHAN